MSVTILVPQPFDQARFRASYEVNLRPPSGRTPGGWVTGDCVENRRLITLCPFCVGKFSPRAYEYELWRPFNLTADCNACGQKSPYCRGFIHESTHDVVGDDRPRRRGRWASWRALDFASRKSRR